MDIEKIALEWQRRGEGPVPRELWGATRDGAGTDPHRNDRKAHGAGAPVGPEGGGPERTGGPASGGEGRSRRIRSWFGTGACSSGADRDIVPAPAVRQRPV